MQLTETANYDFEYQDARIKLFLNTNLQRVVGFGN